MYDALLNNFLHPAHQLQENPNTFILVWFLPPDVGFQVSVPTELCYNIDAICRQDNFLQLHDVRMIELLEYFYFTLNRFLQILIAIDHPLVDLFDCDSLSVF